jgi:hypothetical protein
MLGCSPNAETTPVGFFYDIQGHEDEILVAVEEWDILLRDEMVYIPAFVNLGNV